MQVVTSLPIAHLAFSHWHTDDTEVGIVVAKAAFKLTVDGTLPLEPPPALALVDIFAGDPATTPLIQEQDSAPAKLRTDLVIRAQARSYQGEARRDWPVSITIPDVLTYGFHVRGPSRWYRKMGRWALMEPDPVVQLPLTYALAYGGSCQLGDTVRFFDQNPAGRGFMTDAAAPADGWDAPQIGLLAEFMAARPFAPMTVCGTMPIAKGWLPRRSNAGTFDTAWERNRHPRMPDDYDLGFWNAAPLRLQIAPFLQGDEEVILTGLSHRFETINLRLPGARLVLRASGGQSAPMVLDTVEIDLAGVDEGAVALTFVWRALVRDREDFRQAVIEKA